MLAAASPALVRRRAVPGVDSGGFETRPYECSPAPNLLSSRPFRHADLLDIRQRRVPNRCIALAPVACAGSHWDIVDRMCCTGTGRLSSPAYGHCIRAQARQPRHHALLQAGSRSFVRRPLEVAVLAWPWASHRTDTCDVPNVTIVRRIAGRRLALHPSIPLDAISVVPLPTARARGQSMFCREPRFAHEVEGPDPDPDRSTRHPRPRSRPPAYSFSVAPFSHAAVFASTSGVIAARTLAWYASTQARSCGVSKSARSARGRWGEA